MTHKYLCIYHANCLDGFAAAYALHYFMGRDEVDFHASDYGDAPPDVKSRDVVIVDFSYKREVLLEMARDANSILILDHHKTAQEDLLGFKLPPDFAAWEEYIRVHVPFTAENKVAALFDMNRSGAGMAWDYFGSGARPLLIDYVEDRDLYRFKMSRTREICAGLASYPMTFEVWDHFFPYRYPEQQEVLNDLYTGGLAINRYNKQVIESALPVMERKMIIGGVKMPVVNLPKVMASDAGNMLAQKWAVRTAAVYRDESDHRAFSLRSTSLGLDVAEIAKKYGGGGHQHAAGFKMPVGWEGDE